MTDVNALHSLTDSVHCNVPELPKFQGGKRGNLTSSKSERLKNPTEFGEKKPRLGSETRTECRGCGSGLFQIPGPATASR